MTRLCQLNCRLNERFVKGTCVVGQQRVDGGVAKRPPRTLVVRDGLETWLGDRDSNPNYLIQNQMFYP